MAHFYADCTGSAKTKATRRGTKSSGIECHIRGWEAGVRVRGYYDEKQNCDTFEIYVTWGSNARDEDKLLAVVRSYADGSRSVTAE